MNKVSDKESTHQKTPFFIVDLGSIEEKYNQLKRYLPDVDIHYALKSNSAEGIVKRLFSLGSKFEIASLGELNHLLSLGVDSEDIIFSNPVKIPEHIKKTYEKGVTHFSYDSEHELVKISRYASNASVYLRIIVGDQGSSFPLSRKFGAEIYDAVELLSIAKKIGLKPEGVTFHVGSQAESLNSWKNALDTVEKILINAEEEGIRLETVNLGGGFPVRYDHNVPTLKEIAKEVNKAVKKFPYEVKLLAEPGRFISAEAGTMVASVIGKEVRAGENWLFLDVGVFQGLMESLELSNWHYPVSTSKDNDSVRTVPYILTGPTCDAHDTIQRGTRLPDTLYTGDKVFIHNSGAYSLSYGSTFNGFEIPEVIYVSE